jgi:hypothetical protein
MTGPDSNDKFTRAKVQPPLETVDGEKLQKASPEEKAAQQADDAKKLSEDQRRTAEQLPERPDVPHHNH